MPSPFAFRQRVSFADLALPAQSNIPATQIKQYLIRAIPRTRANDVIRLGEGNPFFADAVGDVRFFGNIPQGVNVSIIAHWRHWEQDAADNAPFRDSEVAGVSPVLYPNSTGNYHVFSLRDLSSNATVPDNEAMQAINENPIDFGLDLRVVAINALGFATNAPHLNAVPNQPLFTPTAGVLFYQFADSGGGSREAAVPGSPNLQVIPPSVLTSEKTRIRISEEALRSLTDALGYYPRADSGLLPEDLTADPGAVELVLVDKAGVSHAATAVLSQWQRGSYLLTFDLPTSIPAGAAVAKLSVKFAAEDFVGVPTGDNAPETFDVVVDRATVFVGNEVLLSRGSDYHTLLSIQAVIAQKLEGRGDVLSYSIGGRQVNTMLMKELTEAEQHYRHRVQAKRRKGGIKQHRIF